MLCLACRRSFIALDSPFVCPRCGRWTGSDAVCGGCIAHPPHFTRGFYAFSFEGPLREAIHAFKFGGRIDVGRALMRMSRKNNCFLRLRLRPDDPAPGDRKEAQKARLQPNVYHGRGDIAPHGRAHRLQDSREDEGDGRPVHAVERREKTEHTGGFLPEGRAAALRASGCFSWTTFIPRAIPWPRPAGCSCGQKRRRSSSSPLRERPDEKSIAHHYRGVFVLAGMTVAAWFICPASRTACWAKP